MENKHISIKKVALIVMILIFACAGIFGVYKIIELAENKTEVFTDGSELIEGGQEKPTNSSEDEKITVDIVSSIVFDLKDVDFRFAIVKIRVKSEEETINIQLDKFKTDEGIRLDQVAAYTRSLESQGYFLGKQNVWLEILSNTPTTMVNIFVPIENDLAENVEILTNFKTPNSMKISLKNPKGDQTLLQYAAEDIITDGKTYQMVVSKAYEITGDRMTQKTSNGLEEYLLPSTVSVYALNIKMVSLWGDEIVVEKAQYIPENSNETFEALDSSIQSMKYSNIIGKTVKDSDTGDLFFVAFNPNDSKMSYKGVLKIKVKGQENWITIQVDLN